MPRKLHPPDPTPFERHTYRDDPLEAIPALERELRTLLDGRLDPLGVTLADARVLRFVVRPVDRYNEPIQGPVRARDIQQFFGLAQRSVQDTLRRLQKAKFVTRKRNPVDGRAWLLRPTKLGSEVAHEAEEVCRITYDTIMSDLASGSAYAIPRILFLLRGKVRELRNLDLHNPLARGLAPMKRKRGDS